jgi:hypothetical protein
MLYNIGLATIARQRGVISMLPSRALTCEACLNKGDRPITVEGQRGAVPWARASVGRVDRGGGAGRGGYFEQNGK